MSRRSTGGDLVELVFDDDAEEEEEEADEEVNSYSSSDSSSDDDTDSSSNTTVDDSVDDVIKIEPIDVEEQGHSMALCGKHKITPSFGDDTTHPFKVQKQEDGPKRPSFDSSVNNPTTTVETSLNDSEYGKKALSQKFAVNLVPRDQSSSAFDPNMNNISQKNAGLQFDSRNTSFNLSDYVTNKNIFPNSSSTSESGRSNNRMSKFRCVPCDRPFSYLNSLFDHLKSNKKHAEDMLDVNVLCIPCDYILTGCVELSEHDDSVSHNEKCEKTKFTRKQKRNLDRNCAKDSTEVSGIGDSKVRKKDIVAGRIREALTSNHYFCDQCKRNQVGIKASFVKHLKISNVTQQYTVDSNTEVLVDTRIVCCICDNVLVGGIEIKNREEVQLKQKYEKKFLAIGFSTESTRSETTQSVFFPESAPKEDREILKEEERSCERFCSFNISNTDKPATGETSNATSEGIKSVQSQDLETFCSSGSVEACQNTRSSSELVNSGNNDLQLCNERRKEQNLSSIINGYFCKICSRPFRTLLDVCQHMKSRLHRNDGGITPSKCLRCDKSFVHINDLLEHGKSVEHSLSNTESEDSLIAKYDAEDSSGESDDVIRGVTFNDNSRKYNVSEAVRPQHQDLDASNVSRVTEHNASKSSLTYKEYRCDVCRKTLQALPAVLSHLKYNRKHKKDNGNTNISCRLCDENFLHIDALVEHDKSMQHQQSLIKLSSINAESEGSLIESCDAVEKSVEADDTALSAALDTANAKGSAAQILKVENFEQQQSDEADNRKRLEDRVSQREELASFEHAEEQQRDDKSWQLEILPNSRPSPSDTGQEEPSDVCSCSSITQHETEVKLEPDSTDNEVSKFSDPVTETSASFTPACAGSPSNSMDETKSKTEGIQIEQGTITDECKKKNRVKPQNADNVFIGHGESLIHITDDMLLPRVILCDYMRFCCIGCNEWIPFVDVLFRHVKKGGDHEKILCTVCDCVLTTGASGVSEHIDSDQHKQNVQDNELEIRNYHIYSCQPCGVKFFRQFELARHERRRHDMKKRRNEDGGFEVKGNASFGMGCTLCQKTVEVNEHREHNRDNYGLHNRKSNWLNACIMKQLQQMYAYLWSGLQASE